MHKHEPQIIFKPTCHQTGSIGVWKFHPLEINECMNPFKRWGGIISCKCADPNTGIMECISQFVQSILMSVKEKNVFLEMYLLKD